MAKENYEQWPKRAELWAVAKENYMSSGQKENEVQRPKRTRCSGQRNYAQRPQTTSSCVQKHEQVLVAYGASASRIDKDLALLFAYLLAEPAINERTAYDHHEWDRQMADRVDRLVVLASLTSALAPLSAPPSLSQSKTDRLNECE